MEQINVHERFEALLERRELARSAFTKKRSILERIKGLYASKRTDTSTTGAIETS